MHSFESHVYFMFISALKIIDKKENWNSETFWFLISLSGEKDWITNKKNMSWCKSKFFFCIIIIKYLIHRNDDLSEIKSWSAQIMERKLSDAETLQNVWLRHNFLIKSTLAERPRHTQHDEILYYTFIRFRCMYVLEHERRRIEIIF